MENENYLTNAPKKERITIQTTGTALNLKHVAGDSVNEHKNLEDANSIISEKEIGQQNENL
ncbi:hypothetical protein [Metabacillus sediminilitoris]|jgi:hypothetical protein|uniref:Uncharacterized protein n=1 Tax=Metabacillus sediminilitoris TaxID=2567941 RepID=A0A4S4BWW2_9BACI|nr:hypothetical protein [Metabacillus sediminilitoris]QGQ46013.1 hypothetical protein GMB29_12710 [Metabacillus sediminilitoris]THF79697.1 hypothetical protein E6W99_11830 [Metabacillus sediminilitoris]